MTGDPSPVSAVDQAAIQAATAEAQKAMRAEANRLADVKTADLKRRLEAANASVAEATEYRATTAAWFVLVLLLILFAGVVIPVSIHLWRWALS